ncbi:MAG: ABC transporter ATP-binding protein [Bacteroidetes bacterium]|nr:ABC transporter ATP-binding protein [Bacteroidota bacterium]
MAFLIVSGISKRINEAFAVKDISFNQLPFQSIAIAGETGSGKTTLLKMIGGFAQPDKGQIFFEGKRVKGPDEKLLPGHPGIAYLSQHFELRNNYYVHEILSYANELTEKEAQTLYSVCKIEHLLNRRTDQLSGGERQRIALAKLLTASPKLLLLDEPFSNLDTIHKNIIKSVLKDLKGRLNISCMIVSHDATDVLGWADTIIVMKNGIIVQQGDPETIYYNPVDEYCAALLGEYNLIESVNNSNYNRRIFCRPEEVLLNPRQTAWEGKVKDCQFRGSYYSIEVETGSQIIKVFSTDKRIKRGDIVYLALTERPYWYL